MGIWFDVCWCYVAVWLWWCGIRMQAEAVLKPAYVQQLNVTYVCRSRKVQSDPDIAPMTACEEKSLLYNIWTNHHPRYKGKAVPLQVCTGP